MTLSLDSGSCENLGDRRAPRPVTHAIFFISFFLFFFFIFFLAPSPDILLTRSYANLFVGRAMRLLHSDIVFRMPLAAPVLQRFA